MIIDHSNNEKIVKMPIMSSIMLITWTFLCIAGNDYGERKLCAVFVFHLNISVYNRQRGIRPVEACISLWVGCSQAEVPDMEVRIDYSFHFWNIFWSSWGHFLESNSFSCENCFVFLPKILNADNVYSCPIWTPLSTLPIEALLIYLREVFLQTGFRPAPAPLYSMATLSAFSSASLSTNTYRTGLTSPPHIRGKM